MNNLAKSLVRIYILGALRTLSTKIYTHLDSGLKMLQKDLTELTIQPPGKHT